MELFPAIDLRDAKAVRLVEGDYGRMTVFSERPADVALQFKEQGAKNLHVVDLDGAKDASLANFETVRRLLRRAASLWRSEAGSARRRRSTAICRWGRAGSSWAPWL